MSDRILITGAAGFVGRHLIDRLVGGGASITGWYRPGAPPSARQDEVRWMAVELLDRDAVSRAIAEARPSHIYHLAAAAHQGQSWQFAIDTYQTNILATHYLLSAAARIEPPPRVLVACSAAIYKPQTRPLREDDALAPGSPYATSKLAQELLAVHVFREEGLPVVIARSFNHTGPGQDPSYVASSLARQVARIEAGLQEPTLRMGNLDPKRDVCDVRDVVRAYEAMLQKADPGQPYNVCSGRAVSIRALTETFTSHARVAVDVMQDPALLRPVDAPVLVGDHSRLTAATGWQPAIPLERTVDDLLHYWRERTA